MEFTPLHECPKRIFFNCFWFQFISEYHKTVGGNFWQPQGSRFTAKFGIGTPPKNKRVSDTLSSRRGPEPNRWSAHLCMNVKKEYLSIFFSYEFASKNHKTSSSSNTIKQLEATFGSRRGAILQQNSDTAHRPKLKVSLTRYQVGVGLNPIDGVHNFAWMFKKNIFLFFLVWICVQIPKNSWMQLLAAAGEPFYSKIWNRNTTRK